MIAFTDFMHSENASAAWDAARQAALLDTDRTIFFPAGVYHFYPEGCMQRYCFFSNNDEGVKTIAIALENVDDLTLKGENAELIFHGRISPLCAWNCRNLHVEGFTIDFEDSFVSDADLIRRENGVAWFRFSGKHKVQDGRLRFTDDFFDNLSGKLPFYPYDTDKKELPFDKNAITIPNKNILFRDGLAGVEDRFQEAGTSAFLVKHELRLCPGMVFDNCTDVVLRNVTLHHAAGMGILMQNCENCLIERAVIAPRNRRASVSDDALHLTECRGKLRIADCFFSGTLDDSINVHGVYRKLKCRVPGGKFYYLEAGHFQQQGVFGVRSGDTLELLKRKTGKPYGKLRISGVVPVNKALVKILFDEKTLPAEFEPGDPGWILETRADLEVVNTECRPLNGRGVLASGMNTVRISGCRLHTSNAGVFISGDYGYWYESGPVGRAVIENNEFDNCNYRVFAATQEPLAVFPELNELPEDFFYHGTIIVRNNRFRSADRPLISIRSAACAEVRDNEYLPDTAYPWVPRPDAGYTFCTAGAPMAAFEHCGKILTQNNRNFRGKKE